MDLHDKIFKHKKEEMFIPTNEHAMNYLLLVSIKNSLAD